MRFSRGAEPAKKCNIYRFQQVAQSHPDMAAAQVAKKLKDRRQKQTLEEIFRKVGLSSKEITTTLVCLEGR